MPKPIRIAVLLIFIGSAAMADSKPNMYQGDQAELFSAIMACRLNNGCGKDSQFDQEKVARLSKTLQEKLSACKKLSEKPGIYDKLHQGLGRQLFGTTAHVTINIEGQSVPHAFVWCGTDKQGQFHFSFDDGERNPNSVDLNITKAAYAADRQLYDYLKPQTAEPYFYFDINGKISISDGKTKLECTKKDDRYPSICEKFIPTAFLDKAEESKRSASGATTS